MGRTLKIVDECSSTNDLVKVMAENGAPHGQVVIAESQTAGRGRFGRFWFSPRGGIWLSTLIRPPKEFPFLDSLPLAGALAIAKPLAEQWEVDAKVSWPNDVVVGRRKIAGVLVESKVRGNELLFVVLGVGINANVDTANYDLIHDTSTSLLSILGREIDREDLIKAVLFEAERNFESLLGSGVVDLQALLGALDGSRGRRVKVRSPQDEFAGVVDGYEGLTGIRIITPKGVVSVQTNNLLSVDYQVD
jgi:BirA family biotin operon repressor/biotin-[acetyl-CoA-carboxylase] ligase